MNTLTTNNAAATSVADHEAAVSQRRERLNALMRYVVLGLVGLVML